MMHQLADILIIVSSIATLTWLGVVGYIIYNKICIIRKLNKVLNSLQDLSNNFSEEALALLFKEYDIEIKAIHTDCERCRDALCPHSTKN